MSASRVAGAFVTVQFALIALLVALPDSLDHPVPPAVRVIGTVVVLVGLVVLAVAALGLGRGLTASPLPSARAELRTNGLYALVRHPVYAGLLLAAAGVVMRSGSVVRLVVALALAILIVLKARWEERRLAERFPAYASYAARTPRFVPDPHRLLRRRNPSR